MSTNGIFRRHKNGSTFAGVPYHPEKKPASDDTISASAVQRVFSDCEDFALRPVWPGGIQTEGVSACWIDGLVSGKAVSADVLRPLTDDRLGAAKDAREAEQLLLRGAVWSNNAKRRTAMDELVQDLTAGYCAVIFDATGEAITFETKTENVRSVDQPTVEKSVKGGKDAFTETLRMNTGLIRRRIHSPALKLQQLTVGRKSGTAVGVFWLDGVANPETLSELRSRIDAIDIDGLVSAGSLEQYIVDRPASPFPQLLHTER
ncbi:spore germination protein, partial [Fibrobacter sp.]|uniref:spore germination protein n=1 Tax=Fibrobacter sp. TaxID=35828 RepID=UPI00388D9401